MEQSTATQQPVAERSQIHPTGDYLTVRQITDELGLSQQYVYKMVREGKIPHVRFGKSVRILRSTFDVWLLAQQITSTEGEKNA